MVFLMSRIREEHVHGLNTREAVEHGIAAIGRVIVAAALIMGTVFAAFILTSDRISKEFGLVLAVAILADALVVKMTLVPAFFTWLGEKTWYIPRWLDKLLPNVTIEPPHDEDGEAAYRGERPAPAGREPDDVRHHPTRRARSARRWTVRFEGECSRSERMLGESGMSGRSPARPRARRRS